MPGDSEQGVGGIACWLGEHKSIYARLLAMEPWKSVEYDTGMEAVK